MNEKSESEKQRVRVANTHVPDKVYAYSLQIKHLLFELLDCNSGDVVSIEVHDDVSIQKPSGQITAIQLKSILSDRNPVSNRATDLWKTLFNWLLSVKSNELNISNTHFILFTTTMGTGSIINQFNLANSEVAAELAWQEARREYFNDDQSEKSISDSNREYVLEFFSPQNKEIACKIIERFKYSFMSCEQSDEDGYTAKLLELFTKKMFIPDDIINFAFDNILGWLDRQTSLKIETGQLMSIRYDDFRSQLMAIQKELNQKYSLINLAPDPTETQVQSELGAVKIYIRQLNLINCDYTNLVQAVNDFIRSATNRTLWAKRGDISENTFHEFTSALYRRWESERDIIEIENRALDALDKGKLLYSKCKVACINMNGLSVPCFFAAGCYHSLADELTIGWHTNYKNLLNGDVLND